MKNKKPYSIPTLVEIYDYIFRRHANGERHQLERKMQQDPFVDDAVEGFTLVGEERARIDIEALNNRISQQKKKTPLYWYTGIAASLVLLIVTGVAYLLMENSNWWQRQQQLAHEQERVESLQEAIKEIDSPMDEEIPALDQAEPIIEADPIQPLPVAPKEKPAEPVMVADAELLPSPDQPKVPEPLPIITPDTDHWVAEDINLAEQIRDTLPVAVFLEERVSGVRTVSGAVGEVREVARQTPLPAAAPGYRIVRAQVLDGDDNSPLPGVTISIAGTTQGTVTDMNGYFTLTVPDREDTQLVFSFIGMTTMRIAAEDIADAESISLYSDLAALQEIVVIGYGVQDNRQGHEQSLHRQDRLNRRDYSPPMPVGGYTQLNRFLRDNALLPDTAQDSRVVVVLRFDVSSNGTPVNFEALRSPSPQYTQMAIDLIRSGPAWQPARMAGSFIQESVRVRIVFRKEQ